jgi:hypothetical protein
MLVSTPHRDLPHSREERRLQDSLVLLSGLQAGVARRLLAPSTTPGYVEMTLPDFALCRSIQPLDQAAQAQYVTRRLRATIVPLISMSSGLVHPHFPTTLLRYYLLTHDQLDSLARWYHQVHPPVKETPMYPFSIPSWLGEHSGAAADRDGDVCDRARSVDLATKRRRFGRFIGLSGCESPTGE